MSTGPETYLHGHHDSVLRSHRWRTAQNSAGYLIGRLPPAADILDIGCGPGTITADLAVLAAPGRWLALYRRVARANGGEPDAGRRLLSWARTAGFASIEASASTWCFTSPQDRAWWGGRWADRLTKSSFGERALGFGLASQQELERMANAWLRWSESGDGWFLIPHGEILCWPSGQD
jgi:hypothetical protein